MGDFSRIMPPDEEEIKRRAKAIKENYEKYKAYINLLKRQQLEVFEMHLRKVEDEQIERICASIEEI